MRNHIAVGVILGSATAACGDSGRRDTAPAASDTAAATQDTSPATSSSGDITVAMRDSAGNDLGSLTLSERGQSIALSGTLSGLPPGVHAIHVHTVGRCDPPKFESAGDHWNPTNMKHGKDAPGGPHFGDLPNLTVGPDGSTSVQATTPGGTLRGANAALDNDGAAVVIHAKRDDYKSQPSGNAGDRIACGVLK